MTRKNPAEELADSEEIYRQMIAARLSCAAACEIDPARKSNPTPATIEAVSAGVGSNPSELFGWPDHGNARPSPERAEDLRRRLRDLEAWLTGSEAKDEREND